MMENEPQGFDKYWLTDDNGDYLMFNIEGEPFRVDAENTEIFIFPDYPDADFIFRWVNYDQNDGSGYRIWRKFVENQFGAGSFEDMVASMIKRMFVVSDQLEPDISDMNAYYQTFNEPIQRRIDNDQIDFIVQNAFKNFDLEWDYYQDEEGWGYGKGTMG